jgi:hypothetical protein
MMPDLYRPRGPQPAKILKDQLIAANLSVGKVYELMHACAVASKEADQHEDVSFYFEQVADYFKEQYNPKKGIDSAYKVLGL